MKRNPALHDLSRDHHDILLHAKRLLGENKRVNAEKATASFALYRDAVLTHHLDEEERFVAPRVEPALGGRLHMIRRELEHTHDAVQLGHFLRLHAKFCEEHLFPALEKELSPAGWKSFTKQSHEFRKAVRPHSIGTKRNEECFL